MKQKNKDLILDVVVLPIIASVTGFGMLFLYLIQGINVFFSFGVALYTTALMMKVLTMNYEVLRSDKRRRKV